MRKYILAIIIACLVNSSFGQTVKWNNGECKSKNYLDSINFEVVKEKIIIPVEINNKVYRFILDTGAPNMISKELYDELKPQLIKGIPIKDANEKIDK